MSGQWKAFAEVTAFAGLLFAAPAGYYYGRGYIIRFQERIYNRLFSISDEQYQLAKQQQEEAVKKEKEAIKMAREAEF